MCTATYSFVASQIQGARERLIDEDGAFVLDVTEHERHLVVVARDEGLHGLRLDHHTIDVRLPRHKDLEQIQRIQRDGCYLRLQDSSDVLALQAGQVIDGTAKLIGKAVREVLHFAFLMAIAMSMRSDSKRHRDTEAQRQSKRTRCRYIQS
jgi:hypothetical protein